MPVIDVVLKKWLIASIVLFCLLDGLYAQTNVQLSRQDTLSWKGFERHVFEFVCVEGTFDAFVTVPPKPLKSKPWVWRARFPGWHTEMDSLLLSEGFHIAYIKTDGMYGSPRAINVWDQFYEYLIKMRGLHGKVALVGVSRGGLFVYNWAKKNPDNVSCIYAEAPVCDFKSWPGGFHDGKGNAANWQELLAEYGFASEQEAKEYSDNPIDNLAGLAQAKVPILHMIGLNDKIVPPDENTFRLVENYLKLGGIATIIPCTTGKQSLQGHHFPIESPRYVADFINYNYRASVAAKTANNE